MAIVKKSELFRKAENDYKKIRRANERYMSKLDPDTRKSIMDECLPKIRTRLQNMFNEISSKLKESSFVDILVVHFVPRAREAAVYSLDLIYTAITGESLRDKNTKLIPLVLAIAVVFCNTIWHIVITSIFMLYNKTKTAALKGRVVLSIAIAPVMEETAKSIALERDKGFQFVTIFGGMEFAHYVISFAPKFGLGTIVMIRTVTWMFHFFTLLVQDIIPDKSFSWFLAVMLHLAWNAGGAETLMSPVLPTTPIRKDLIHGNRI